MTNIYINVESETLPDFLKFPNVIFVPLSAPPPWFQTNNKALFLVFGPLKVAFQIGSLFAALAYGTRPSDWLIVQVCTVRLFPLANAGSIQEES